MSIREVTDDALVAALQLAGLDIPPERLAALQAAVPGLLENFALMESVPLADADPAFAYNPSWED